MKQFTVTGYKGDQSRLLQVTQGNAAMPRSEPGAGYICEQLVGVKRRGATYKKVIVTSVNVYVVCKIYLDIN